MTTRSPPLPSAPSRSDTSSSVEKPMLDGRRSEPEQWLVKVFVVVPPLALLAAVPLAWGWGMSWLDVGLAVGFYLVSGLGVTAGFHRYFTHRAFRTGRALRMVLALAGSLALQGSVPTWVADHRRHHTFADLEGDPRSPWRSGTSRRALARGFVHAHTGWLFDRDATNTARFAPDLLADRDIQKVHAYLPLSLRASRRVATDRQGSHLSGGRRPGPRRVSPLPPVLATAFERRPVGAHAPIGCFLEGVTE